MYPLAILTLGNHGMNIAKTFREQYKEVEIPIVLLETHKNDCIGSVGAAIINGTFDQNLSFIEGQSGKQLFLTANNTGEIDEELILHSIQNYNRIIIITDLSSRGGARITPYLADLLKRNRIEMVLTVIMPFNFEGHNNEVLANNTLLTLEKSHEVLTLNSPQEKSKDIIEHFFTMYQQASNQLYEIVIKELSI